MAFLELNEWAIPIASGGKSKDVRIGSRSQALSGRPLVDERARARRWECETVPTRLEKAIAIQGAVNGLGHLWSFDSDIYSTKGLGPESGDETLARIRTISTAGNNVLTRLKDDYGVFDRIYSAQAYTSLSNLLTSNQASPSSGTFGFSASGPSISRVTDDYLERGAVYGDGFSSGDYVETNVRTTTAAAAHVGVAHFRATGVGGAETIFVSLYDGTGLLGSATVTGPEEDKWYRVHVSGTTTDTDIKIRISYVGAGTAYIWMDQLAIYRTSQRSSTIAPPWIDGGAATGASDAKYDVSGIDWTNGLSFEGWVFGPSSGDSNDNYIFSLIGADSFGRTQSIKLLRSASTNDIELEVVAPGSATGTVNYSSTPWNNEFHHIAVTWSPTDQWRLFYDGSEVGTSLTRDIDLSTITDLWLGNDQGTADTQWEGHFAEVSIYPYQLHEDQIAAYAAATMSKGNSPLVRASGDFAPNSALRPIFVSGDAEDMAYKARHLDSSWRNNAQSVAFALHEDIRA